MDDDAKNLLINNLRKEIRENLDIKSQVTDEDINELITDKVFEEARLLSLSIREKQELISVLFNSIRKLDILQPLIDDKSITEIMVNGEDNIFIEKHGRTYSIESSFESR